MKNSMYTELSFERVVSYLQCRGIYLVKENCSNANDCITFNYTYDGDGDIVHCFIIGFPEGGSKKGKQYIDFCEAYGDSEGSCLIKRFKCDDIMNFAREFEEFAYGKFALDSSEDFSYLEEKECALPPSIDEDDNWETNEVAWQQKRSVDIFEKCYRVELKQEDDIE